MKSFKGRTVSQNQLVDVYRNLHTGGFSIRDAKTKRVLVHADTVKLKDCTCFVSQAGREKTIQERRKRVHAWIRGAFICANERKPNDFKRVINYDPYKTTHFRDSINQQAIFELKDAYFEGSVVYTK